MPTAPRKPRKRLRRYVAAVMLALILVWAASLEDVETLQLPMTYGWGFHYRGGLTQWVWFEGGRTNAMKIEYGDPENPDVYIVVGGRWHFEVNNWINDPMPDRPATP